MCSQAFLHSVHQVAVQHKLRLNLRPLAEVQTLLWTPALALLCWLAWHVLRLIVLVIMLPMDQQANGGVQTMQPHTMHQTSRL